MNAGQAIGNLLFQLCPLILALSHHPTLPALVPAALLGRAVSVIVLGLACQRLIPLTGRPHFAAQEIKPLLHYGGWVTVTALAGPLLTVFDRFVIGALSGITAVTAYTVPFNLVNYLMIFPVSLQKALTPTLTAASEPEARQYVLNYTRLLTALMTITILLALLGMRPFLDLWLGPRLAPTTGTHRDHPAAGHLGQCFGIHSLHPPAMSQPSRPACPLSLAGTPTLWPDAVGTDL
ncbi:polysaccharide biosynthesis family protein, partial [mine drainage metagenome]